MPLKIASLSICFSVFLCHAEAVKLSHALMPRPRAVDSATMDNALSDLIAKHGGKLPATLDELREQLDTEYRGWPTGVGNLVIPFSDAPKYTDLIESRIVFTSPTSDLQLGVVVREKGPPDFEFIAWNHQTKEYDFGVVKGFGTPHAKPVLVDKSGCLPCHRNGAAVFAVADWEHTAGINFDLAFSGVYRAFVKLLAQRDARYKALYERVKDGLGDRFPLATKPADKAPRWNGADLDPPDLSGVTEDNVRDSNQVAVIHAYVRSLPNDERRELVRGLLQAAVAKPVLGKADESVERFLKALSPPDGAWVPKMERFPGNRPFLFRSNPLSHLKVADPKDREAMVRAHELKRARRLKNTAEAESPATDGILIERSKPLFGAGTSLMDENSLLAAYRSSLGITPRRFTQGENNRFLAPAFLSEKELARFVASNHFQEMLKSDQLPDRRDFTDAIARWQKGQPAMAMAGGKKSQVVSETRTCATCHVGDDSVYDLPFDPGSLPEWRRRLAGTPKQKQEAYELAPIVLRQIVKGKMPPKPFRSHFSPEERERLIRLLQDVKKDTAKPPVDRK